MKFEAHFLQNGNLIKIQFGAKRAPFSKKEWIRIFKKTKTKFVLGRGQAGTDLFLIKMEQK